jgi:hypothetical protein
VPLIRTEFKTTKVYLTVININSISKDNSTHDRKKRSRGLTLGASRCSYFIGDIVMRILSKKALKELVLYSHQHVARLERAGRQAMRNVRFGGGV